MSTTTPQNPPSDALHPVFLNVEQSLSGRKWVDRLDPLAQRNATTIEQTLEITELLARVLAGRGVDAEGATSFLKPTLRDLMPDPSSLVDMDSLAARITKAITTHEKVALFGDYDVDGASSVALMARYLRSFGLDPELYIPDRIFEGYGPNNAAMDSLIENGATLIITLDCGTASIDAIQHAVDKGAEVLVIDHHLSEHELPPALAVVNPNRADDVSGLGHLCAAGVTFMVLVALNRDMRKLGHSTLPDLMALLDIVALATICDVVPLQGLNRAFVLRGLEMMRQGANRGLTALALAARVTSPLNAYHLGFMLGPRINAGGRIGDAALGARLLLSTDEHETLAIAAQLDELNAERQRIERLAVEEAIATAETEIGSGDGPALLVQASASWHAGVVGLVAARLKERFNRPAFAISIAPNGIGTGSGRSIPGVNLGVAVIAAVAEGVAQKGGGHAMAAGVTIAQDKLAAFRAFVTDHLAEQVVSARAETSLKIDAALSARAASIDFVHELERAGPFGMGNPNPVFAMPAHFVRNPRIVGQGGHISFTTRSGDGANLKSIAFCAAGTPLGDALLNAGDTPIHLVGSLGIDHWQGREQVQFRVFDGAMPG